LGRKDTRVETAEHLFNSDWAEVLEGLTFDQPGIAVDQTNNKLYIFIREQDNTIKECVEEF
jgi:hypothetical protein